MEPKNMSADHRLDTRIWTFFAAQHSPISSDNSAALACQINITMPAKTVTVCALLFSNEVKPVISVIECGTFLKLIKTVRRYILCGVICRQLLFFLELGIDLRSCGCALEKS